MITNTQPREAFATLTGATKDLREDYGNQISYIEYNHSGICACGETQAIVAYNEKHQSIDFALVCSSCGENNKDLPCICNNNAAKSLKTSIMKKEIQMIAFQSILIVIILVLTFFTGMYVEKSCNEEKACFPADKITRGETIKITQNSEVDTLFHITFGSIENGIAYDHVTIKELNQIINQGPCQKKGK